MTFANCLYVNRVNAPLLEDPIGFGGDINFILIAIFFSLLFGVAAKEHNRSHPVIFFRTFGTIF